MFVTVDSEDLARKVIRRAQNCIRCEGTERKIKEDIKILIIIYLKKFFTVKYK